MLAATAALAIGVAVAVAEMEIADDAMVEDMRIALEVREADEVIADEEEVTEEATELDTGLLVAELESNVDSEAELTEEPEGKELLPEAESDETVVSRRDELEETETEVTKVERAVLLVTVSETVEVLSATGTLVVVEWG